MKLRVLDNRWQLMLAVNIAMPFGDLLYKITLKPTFRTFIYWSTTISASPSGRENRYPLRADAASA